MSSSEDYRKLAIGNISESEMKKATELYDAIVSAMRCQQKLREKSNAELADLLINHVWSEEELFTAKSELIDEIANRLRTLPDQESEAK